MTFPKGRMHGKRSNVLRSTHWTGSQRVGRRKMRDEKKKKREVEELDLSNTEAKRARSNENDKCL